MHEHDIYSIADRVVFTPAERALIVEQAETARIELEKMINSCRKGEASGNVIRAYIPVVRSIEYLSGIVNNAVQTAVLKERD